MAEPSAQEVLMWALINRARLDPLGEAARFGIDLNEGLPAGTLNGFSRQPLAFNNALQTAADGHSQAMINQDFFDHVNPATLSNPGTRATDSVFGCSGLSENIAARPLVGPLDPTTAIVLQHQDLFVDAGIDERGHRLNILNDTRQEIGIGQVVGGFVFPPPNPPVEFQTSMVTQDFGRPLPAGGQFLTGIAYNDFDANAFYSVGEGRVVFVNHAGGGVATGAAGAYSTSIGFGPQIVNFFGGDLGATVSVVATVNAGRNALINLVGQSTVETSVSVSEFSGISTIIGLGNLTLNLVGSDNGAESIFGGQGNDFLFGLAGADAIAGGVGNDVIYGGAGNDFLYGGFGVDSIVGEAGADNFITPVNELQAGVFDYIFDFQDGAGGDNIVLQGWSPALLGVAQGAGYVYISSGSIGFAGGIIVLNATVAQVLDQIFVV